VRSPSRSLFHPSNTSPVCSLTPCTCIGVWRV
jgi:hypothetical protein